MKQSQLSDAQKSQQLQSNTINILNQDHSTSIFFSFQITISILMIIKYDQQLIFTTTVCLLNVIFAISLLASNKNKRYERFANICVFISRISTLLFIALLNQELKISLIVLLHSFNNSKLNQIYFNYFEVIFVRIFALTLVIINYDLICIISVSFQLLLELNKLVYVKDQVKIEFVPNQVPFAQSLISQKEQDNLWKNRIQTIPVSFFMINYKTLRISFKNQTATAFFSLFCDSDEEYEQLILNKLQFSLVQDNIDQIQHSLSNLKIRQRLRTKYNKKYDSEIQHSDPCNNLFSSSSPYHQQFSKQIDSFDQNKFKFSLSELINNIQAGEFKEYISNNSVELFCQETLGVKKTIQLAGQILINQSNDEVIVLLNDISKQNELQQLISTDEFKSKIIESFSHELRTPLNGAVNFLSALLHDSDTTDQNKNNYILPAISSLKIQSYLISDVIDFQQQYAKNFQLQNKEFTIKDLVCDITSLFTVQCKLKQLEFDVDLIDCCTNVICTDYGRLMQILVNLLQNAIKFSTDGLIVLKLSSYSKDIIKFTVTDMGQGVADSNITTIQSYLNNLNNQKDIQLNKSWQGFGLLISAILVQKLGPTDRSSIKFESEGINMGAKVSFFIKNLLAKGPTYKQPTIRQNTNRLQSSHNLTSSYNNLNGTIIQTTEFFTKNANRKKNTKLITQRSNDNSIFTESVVFDTVDQKFGLLMPVQPSLITDIVVHRRAKVQNQSRIENSSQRSNQSRILSIQLIKQAEDQEDEELFQTYKRRKKCQCQRIMSVDDEIFNQKSIQLLLSKMGFEVILAFNGQQACQDIVKISRCGKNCQLLTLILMDYQMPILNGCQATEKLIEMMNQNLIPKIHIIGLTAFTNMNDIDNCIKSGMSDVLHKPLNLKEFKEILTLV